MKTGKYFDWQRNVPLSESDGSEYEQWKEGEGRAPFARLGEHIYIFLDPDEIESSDRYEAGVFDLELDTESAFHRMRIESTLHLLRRFELQAGAPARILSMGCGPGHFLEAVHDRYTAAEITGLDVSLSALRRAAERLPEADFVLADAYDPPFGPGQFDAILLNNVIEHVSNPTRLLRGVERVLAPGGCLVLSTPSRYRFGNLIRVIVGKPAGLMAEDHVTEYSVGQVIDLLRGAGLEAREVLGPKRKPVRWTTRNVISHHLIKPALQAWLRVVGSNHVIEGTSFFLAMRPS